MFGMAVMISGAACTKMSLASKAEDGCGAYEFAWDIQDPNVLRIFEQWDSQQAIDGHFAAPHMAEYRTRVAGLVKGVSLQVLEPV